MTEHPAAMKNRCVAWEKKIETNANIEAPKLIINELGRNSGTK